MGHRLDKHRQLIFDLKASGEAVRSIAAKLSEASGERVAPSTVQHFISTQRNASSEPDWSVLMQRLDRLENIAQEILDTMLGMVLVGIAAFLIVLAVMTRWWWIGLIPALAFVLLIPSDQRVQEWLRGRKEYLLDKVRHFFER